MKSFKGWAVPGMEIPFESASIQAASDETLDALCGHFRLFQLADGHRFSTDDVLVAWYGTLCAPSAGHALDLGSGLGTVALLTAWRLRGVRLVTIEAQDISIALARKSIAYNGCAERFDVRHGDFRDPSLLRTDETFDLVTGSPPYFPLDSGLHGDHPQKVACRFEVRGSIADYCEVAARHLAWGGVFVCVFPIQPEHQDRRVSDAADAAGLLVVRRRDVIFKEGEPPLLAVFAMMKREHMPQGHRPFIEPTLVIRDASGRVTPEYLAIKLSMGLPPTG